MTVETPLLTLSNFTVRYGDYAPAVDSVDLELHHGETLGIVGESGSGKSSLARAIVGLARFQGRMRWRGEDLTLDTVDARREWARRCQLVFQDPQASLDPRMKAWEIVTEPCAIAGMSAPARMDLAAELLRDVGMTDECLDRRPHQFSGGQRQRIAIARGLAISPELVILDEPTSALDMSVQARILNLLLALQQQRSLGYLFISHDLAVVAHMCDRVAVMRNGHIVEIGPVAQVVAAPEHDYTRTLIAANRILSRAVPSGSGKEVG